MAIEPVSLGTEILISASACAGAPSRGAELGVQSAVVSVDTELEALGITACARAGLRVRQRAGDHPVGVCVTAPRSCSPPANPGGEVGRVDIIVVAQLPAAPS